MLQRMREAQTWMIKGVLWAVVLAFVVTIFYQWGVRSRGGPTSTEVATILGQPVGVREFQRVQSNIYQQYRAMFRAQPEFNLNEHFNFREMALEQLATRAILLRLTRQEGFVVTDEELYDRIAAIPAFHTQGRFDSTRYETVLRSQVPPIPPQQFEAEQRQDLLLEKVHAAVSQSVQVTEYEAESAYRLEHEQVAVRYVLLAPTSFTDQIKPTDEEIQKYYETHKETYREPEQRQIRYAAVSLQRFMVPREFTADEIAAYYEQHLNSFQQAERVRARHILFKVPANASAEQEAQQRTQAETVLAALREGADFATLAQQSSEDPATAEQGGDLGFFPRGQMVKPFEDEAFSLPIGEVSAPLRTTFGWHLLRVEDKQSERTKTLEEAQPEIRAQLQEAKGREALEAFLDDMVIALERDPGRFVELGTQRELDIVTTPFIPSTGRVEKLENVPDFVRRAFALAGQAVETVKGPDGTHYILQVAERRPASIQEFAVVQERVRQDLRTEKSAELAGQTADEWLTKMRAGTPLAELAASLQASVVESGLFKRQDTIPQLGRLPALNHAAFGLAVGTAGVVHEGTRHVVLEVVERQSADMQAYEKEAVEYRKKLLERKRQQMLQAFQQSLRAQYQKLRQQGDIAVNPSYVF